MIDTLDKGNLTDKTLHRHTAAGRYPCLSSSCISNC